MKATIQILLHADTQNLKVLESKARAHIADKLPELLDTERFVEDDVDFDDGECRIVYQAI